MRDRVARLATAILEIGRILRALPAVEIGRRKYGPAPLLEMLRSAGRRGAGRSYDERRRLARFIKAVDRLLPDGGNCYRRALIGVALDATWAREPLCFGVREHGGPKTGHAWLQGMEEAPETYDAVFTA